MGISVSEIIKALASVRMAPRQVRKNYANRIAFLGDSITAFPQKYPRAIGDTSIDWVRYMGGISYDMPTGTGTLEFRASDQKLRWTAPGDTAGPWTASRMGFVLLSSGTAGAARQVMLGIRTNFFPGTDVTLSPAVTADNLTWCSTGFWNYAQMLTGQIFEFDGCYGIEGDRLLNMMDRIDQVFDYDVYSGAAKTNPVGWVVVLGGTNDLVADASSTATVITRLTSVVEQIINYGARPVVCTILPRNNISQTYLDNIMIVNHWIKTTLPTLYAEIVVVDLWSTIRDPAGSGLAISGYLSTDNTHNSNLSALVEGQALATSLLTASGMVQGRARIRTIDHPSNFLNAKSPMFGSSGGAVAGGASGTVPALWKASTSGSTVAAVVSLGGTSPETNWVTFTCTGASNGDVVIFNPTTQGTPATYGLTAGDIIDVECEIEVVSATNLRHVELQVCEYTTDGSIVHSSCNEQSTSSGRRNVSIPIGVAVHRTPKFALRSDCTVFQVFVKAVFNASGAAVFRVRCMNGVVHT